MLFHQTIDGMGQTLDHYAYCNQLFCEYSKLGIKHWYQTKDDDVDVVGSIQNCYSFSDNLKKRFFKTIKQHPHNIYQDQHEPNVNKWSWFNATYIRCWCNKI